MKLAQKDLTPAQIGGLAERKVLQYFSLKCKHVSEADARWIGMWVRKEVREAIKRERKIFGSLGEGER